MNAINILLVEDSESDAELTIEALRRGRVYNTVSHVRDGAEALRYLFREEEYASAPTPDLILLDLNMPGINGKDVLRKIRDDDKLRIIPVVVLTTSSYDQDILASYGLYANSYIVKPVDLTSFFEVVQSIKSFWLQVVKLPPKLQP